MTSRTDRAAVSPRLVRARPTQIRRARPWLGTLVSIALTGPEEAEAVRRIEAGFAAIAKIHGLMSFHETASDVSRLNRGAARAPVRVDPATYSVIAQALTLSADSHGAFDITVAGRLVRLGHLPRPDDAPQPADGACWRDITLLPDNQVRFEKPTWIDLGGIAKGFAVDRAVAAMAPEETWQCVVNAGGDLRVVGPGAERVLLRAPEQQDILPVVLLRQSALASSSGIDKAAHIDGRNGRSVGARSFVSVVAQNCVIADGLTKIVLALGAAAGPILKARGATAYLWDSTGWRTLGDENTR